MNNRLTIDGFARWLLTFGASVEIVGPGELRVKMEKLVNELWLRWK